VPVPGEGLTHDPAIAVRWVEAFEKCQLALRDLELRMLQPLQASGVEITQDFSASPTFVASLSSQAALLALQDVPQVTGIYENHRVVLSLAD